MKNAEIRNLCKSYGKKQIIKDLSFDIPAGKATVITGASGSGKTTLLRILAGLERYDSGSIRNMPEKISVVFQEDRLCEEFSPMGNMRFITGRSADEGKLREILAALKLDGDEDTPVKELSGGMKRRTAIARALGADYGILLMDEPFKGLDTALKNDVMSFVREYNREKTVVLITHDENEADFFGGAGINMMHDKR